MSGLDLTLAALADPTRRAIVEKLRRGAQPVGALVAALDAPAPAVSKHLRVLREAGLIRQSIDPDDARVRVVEVVPAPLGELRDWLDEAAAFWDDQLAAFAQHAERARRRRRR